MAVTSPSILVTAAIAPSWVATAREHNILLDILPFIETTINDSIEIHTEVEQAATLLTTVVFTSGNAVEAVTEMLAGEQPQWRIYCVGEKTGAKAVSYFGEESLAGVEHNATSLAARIIEDGEVDELIFFCGNLRRDELPMLLEEESIGVQEIEVYQTVPLTHKLDKKYNAIVFFSPSAADSFFTDNIPDPGANIFVIGETTRKAVQRYCKNRITVAAAADRDQTVEEAIGYFS